MAEAKPRARPGPGTESCADCMYYWPDPDNVTIPPGAGLCLRYPPIVGFTGGYKGGVPMTFPVTQATWWCGEHVAAV